MSNNEPKMKVIVVDDEAPARQLMQELLGEHQDIEVIAECANGFEAVKAVAELSPDLIFLDIQMPKLDGFEVVELLEDPSPAIIFVTAYDAYALRAFEIHALDYLLKPISADRLADALNQARARSTSPVSPPKDLARARDTDRPLDRVLVRDGSRVHVVPAHRIDYIEAQDDVVVVVSGDLRLRKAQRLGDLEKALDSNRFLRVHRSYLLNLDRIDRIELYAKDSRIAILRDGTRLPVSRSGYSRLKERL